MGTKRQALFVIALLLIAMAAPAYACAGGGGGGKGGPDDIAQHALKRDQDQRVRDLRFPGGPKSTQ